MAELECPKCHSPMRSYERSGLTVDQCTGCRGIFLDRGELERLVDAEGAYYEKFPGGREPEHDDRRPDKRRYEDDDDRHEHRGGGLSEVGGLGGLLGGGHGKHGHRKKHKRESFLGDLFD
jgi:Zn-finger nucleic acid-binding protein